MFTVDRLSALFERFRVRAHLFHMGQLCGSTHLPAQPGRAFLHVLRSGHMRVEHRAASGLGSLQLTEPSLLLYPRPLDHTFHNPPQDGSDLVCATLDFEGGEQHPLVRALPPLVALPLAQVQGIEHTIALLFAETESLRCGQRVLADRLFEVLLIQILRWLLDPAAQRLASARSPGSHFPDAETNAAPRPATPQSGQPDVHAGLIAGLADPQLARALTAVHEQPGAAWSLERMAEAAGMSRSAFAARFRSVVGQPPGDYLADWRLTLAKSWLRSGRPVKTVAADLGYANASALSRAFAQRLGIAPRDWLKQTR
ncbi:MAG TPA: AraC family transcriptional regulator [Burkholderiaceae bacterium]|nr:AraC family transcriptional regulator [Burkholderiaceae bacterium]